MWREWAPWALVLALAAAGCGDANVDSPFNRRPRAVFGYDAEAPWGQARLVSSSTDPDGDLLSHQWTIVSVPDGSLLMGVEGDGEVFEFAMDVPGYYGVALMVSDGEYASSMSWGIGLP